MRGVVERLVPAEGFGIIRGEDGNEYFLHANAVNRDDLEDFAEGWLVDFSVSPHHEGDRPGELPRASHVELAPGQFPAVDNEPLPPGKVD